MRAVLTVRLNGTDVNLWRRYGLTQNPFPQIARAELGNAMKQLGSLDGEPLSGPEDIRARLAGWSEEFIDICLQNYVPGERVVFDVSLPEESAK